MDNDKFYKEKSLVIILKFDGLTNDLVLLFMIKKWSIFCGGYLLLSRRIASRKNQFLSTLTERQTERLFRVDCASN